MPYVQGWLNVRSSGHPDHELPGGGGRPDNALPGDQPGIDNSLPGMPAYPSHGLPPNGVIDNELPMPPPGVWPPPTASHPIVPAPGVPPGAIWPPIGRPPSWGGGLPANPARPDNSLPGSQPGVDNTLPAQPGIPDNTLPAQPPRPDNALPSQTFWVVVGIPGVGWRFAALDPSLQPGMPLPPTTTPPPTAGTPLPPTPEPK
jgi:hypothetical protein